MALARTFKLNTDALIPAIGLGVPALSVISRDSKDSFYKGSVYPLQYKVKKFLNLGFRHIDTSHYVNFTNTNDGPMGGGVRSSKVKREDIFITQKLWNNQHLPEQVTKSCEASLGRSKLRYYDLYLMHWPIALKDATRVKTSETDKASEAKETKTSEAKVTETLEAKNNPENPDKKSKAPAEIDDSIDFVDTYLAMESLVRSGQVKAIGVANFGIKRLEKLLKKAKIPPAVNQVEMHPYLPQNELLEFCKSHNIHVTSSLPFGIGKSSLRSDEIITKIAEKNKKSKFQVLAAWAVQRGTSIITDGALDIIAEKVFQDYVLPEEDFQQINELSETKNVRYITRKGWNFEWD
ncbi:8012_t:CDS:2 [Ambispora leptoticha]|uniref:8012_t:CDS:1 n=1 Tax=Ambispora leptoticha TaxID=144679 RepID=A0A9N8YRW8_9GLOM|nr:8012_t:CDS:2 [Ambispora leptoticha]